MDTGDRTDPMDLGSSPKTPSGHLWIAFMYTGTEALIGRYDPREERFAFINVSDEDEGAVQQGTRHIRSDASGAGFGCLVGA